MPQIVVIKLGRACFQTVANFQKIEEILRIGQNNNLVLVVSALPEIAALLKDCAMKADTCSSYDHDLNMIKRRHLELVQSLMEDPYQSRVQQFFRDKFEYLEEILKDIEEYGLSDNKLDIVLSFGEILSSYILNQYLIARGFESEYLLGDRFLITDSRYNNALPIMNISVRKVRSLFLPLLKLGHIPVVTGFIGRNKEGHLTTLGAGGTDFTAALLAYCLKDEDHETKVIFWKETDGILNCDPQIVPSARTIPQLSYEEAKEFAIGTGALHPKCIQPIQNREIPLEIRNARDLTTSNYTLIQKESIYQDAIIGIIYREEVAMISAISESTVEIPGVLAQIFAIMGQNEINISMISQTSSEINTMFVVEADVGLAAKEALLSSEFFKDWFEIRVESVGMISIIGSGVNRSSNLAKLFQALQNCQVQILALSQAANGLNLTLLVKKEDVVKAIQTLHKDFNLHI
ncbi:MAG: aspartate kinase [Candidatus Helarchaeota archaeon]